MVKRMVKRISYEEWVVKNLKSQKIKIKLLLILTVVFTIVNSYFLVQVNSLEKRLENLLIPTNANESETPILNQSESLASFDLTPLPMNLKPIKN